ncbi:hypothetical protein [Bacillus haynesii]|uniref:hypothetical protein n=1 Tax=Bacillus haynesii TaxID=1925021 RepID=UPI0022801E6D|nr:hypothetical protein [Bacillus haynesii]MCY9372674.1 hypothetical protein [Bacillus haynesii]MEC0719001.1 hypothetical protein [Bacillus haynesii]
MDKAMEYIDKLAAKLGVAAEHVYGVLVKQAVANSITDLFCGVIAFAAAIVLGVLIAKIVKRRFNVSEWDVEWFFLLIIVGILVIFPFVMGVDFSTKGIKALINPEYYAIKEILDTIGGK